MYCDIASGTLKPSEDSERAQRQAVIPTSQQTQAAKRLPAKKAGGLFNAAMNALQ